jgi:hypothetical protein
LDEQYWKERRSKVETEAKQNILSQEELEARIKTDNKITDEEIKLCSGCGIDKIIEIGYAKKIAQKYNTNLEHVAIQEGLVEIQLIRLSAKQSSKSIINHCGIGFVGSGQ